MSKFKVSVTSGNSKMGIMANLSLPPIVTCRANTPCAQGCYGLKGVYLYKNVRQCHINNLEAFKSDSKDFKMQILSQIPIIGMFRWHTVGDIVNDEYLQIMVDIAKKTKGVKFLAFTKQYEMINKYLETKKLPTNLKVVFSGWKGLEMDNPYNLPTAWMLDHKDVDERIPKDSLPCGGGCATCGVCFNLRKRQSVFFLKH